MVCNRCQHAAVGYSSVPNCNFERGKDFVSVVQCLLCIEKEARCILFCYNRTAVCNIYVLWIIDAQHCAHDRQYSPYEREKISLNKINFMWYSLVDGFLAGSVFDGFKHINIHYLVNNVWIHETRHFIPYYKTHAPSATNSSAHIHTMSLLHTNLSSLQKKHKFPNIIPHYGRSLLRKHQ